MSAEGYKLGMSGARVGELLERQFVVPTLDSVPDLKTRNWADGGYTVAFRIGELCRVKVDGKWKFYRLEDIVGSECVWVKANASELPDMSDYYTKEEVDKVVSEKEVDLSGYYTKEEADSKIDEKIQAINFPEDESIKYASRAEYDAWKEAGAVSDKTLYVIMEGGEPVELLIGSHQIAVKDLGSKGFPYSFPIIF